MGKRRKLIDYVHQPPRQTRISEPRPNYLIAHSHRHDRSHRDLQDKDVLDHEPMGVRLGARTVGNYRQLPALSPGEAEGVPIGVEPKAVAPAPPDPKKATHPQLQRDGDPE